MVFAGKVREHVRKYFNPEDFNPREFRDVLMVGFLGLLLAELVVYIMLQHSAHLGELPHYITDVFIICMSLLEFLVVPLISWLGLRRRRSVLVGWTLAALVCMIPLFALPETEVTAEPDFCNSVVPLNNQITGISEKAVIRLSMLLTCGLVSALARAVYISHGLAYLEELKPSEHLHMHVGIFVLHRVMVYLLGTTLSTATVELPYAQPIIISVKYLITLVRLFRYPEVAPGADKARGSDRGLFRSMRRVLGNRVAVLQILAMSLLAAAWWGFGMHETTFVLVKYYIRPDVDSIWGFNTMMIRVLSIFFAVILAGFIYTTPVMPKFDRKSAVANATKLCFLASVAYVVMTALLSCNRSGIGGLDELKYSQPACGQNCGCDRPWTEFTPVCVPEQMTTYFSPCHAGCPTADTVNSVGVYSNCTCAPGGRVIIGACDDGSCANVYSLHQMCFIVVSLTSTLAIAWQTSVVLEVVDKKDVAVAVGLASGVVALFAFAGAHGLYIGISYFTCAFTRGSKCLLQNDLFITWVGYSSAVLAGLSFILSIFSCIILRRQK